VGWQGGRGRCGLRDTARATASTARQSPPPPPLIGLGYACSPSGVRALCVALRASARPNPDAGGKITHELAAHAHSVAITARARPTTDSGRRRTSYGGHFAVRSAGALHPPLSEERAAPSTCAGATRRAARAGTRAGTCRHRSGIWATGEQLRGQKYVKVPPKRFHRVARTAANHPLGQCCACPRPDGIQWGF